MSSEQPSFLQNLQFKLALLAIPVYVWPRVWIQSRLRGLLRIPQPSLSHLYSNQTIQWLSASLSLDQFRTATGGAVDIQKLIDDSPYMRRFNAKTSVVSENNPSWSAIYTPQVPNASHTVLYVHGGGFVSGSPSGVAKYLLQLFIELSKRGLVCDILSVSYDLAPERVYPHALGQVAAAYGYAARLGKPIILMGDSAGGNLCLALLRHLSEPHPLLANVDENVDNAAIQGVCLVSPWVNLRNDSAAVEKYAHFDCLDPSVLHFWTKSYLGPHSHDCYSNPIQCLDGWVSALPPRMMLIVGEYELFVDDVVELADNIRADGYKNLELIVAPRKCHAWPSVDYAFETDSEEVISAEIDTKATALGLAGIRMQADWLVKGTLT